MMLDYETYMRLYGEKKFNDLNDDCIITIFQHIPLAELLRLEIVCKRWQFCQEAIFARRKTKLVLTDNNPDITRNWYNEIKRCYRDYGIEVSTSYHFLCVDLKKPKNAELLLNKIPYISKLEVVYDSMSDSIEQLLMLLEAWKDNLTHLKLIFYNGAGTTLAMWKRIFEERINLFPKLKSLIVKESTDYYRNRADNTNSVTLSPNLIANLEDVFIGLNQAVEFTFNYWNVFNEDSKLQSLRLDTTPFRHQNWEWDGVQQTYIPSLDSINEDFAKKLSELALFWYGSTEFLSSMFKFSGLTTLHLKSELSFTDLARRLTRLRKLKELRLLFSSNVFPDKPIPSDTRVYVLPSIETLHLDCSNKTAHWNRDQNYRSIPHGELAHVMNFIPNIVTIRVNAIYINENTCRVDRTHKKQDCRDLFIKSLKDYRALRKVYFLNNAGFSGWEESNDERLLAKYQVVYMLNGEKMNLESYQTLKI